MPNTRKAKYILEAEDRTKLALKKAERNFDKFGKSVMRSMGPLLGIAAGAGMASFIDSTLDMADALAKSADRLGLTTDQLQEYNFAAERSGMTTEQLASSMLAFVKRVGEARAGTGPLVSFLKKYDEQLLQNIKNSKDQDEALGFVAESIKKAGTATDKAAIANAAFSRSGIGMVNMLNDGTAGLDELRQAAIDAGVVLDEDLLRSAERINDAFDTLTNTIGTKFKRALLEVASGYEEMYQVYLKWQGANDDHQIAELQHELVDLTGQLKEAEKVMKLGGGAATSMSATYEYLKNRVADLRAEIKGLIGTVAEDRPASTTATGGVPSKPASTKKDPFGAAIQSMQRQLAMLDTTTQYEKTLWEVQNGRYKSLTENQQKALLDAARAMDIRTQEIAQQKESDAATQEYIESQEDAAQAWRDLLDPAAELFAQLAQLDKLLAEGRISWDIYADGVFHVMDAMDDLEGKAEETNNELSVFADEAARNMQNAFADFLFDPFDGGLKGMAANFAETLRRMASDALAASIFENLFKGVPGGGLGSFLGTFFHDGGIVGEGGTARAVNPLVFAGAPRYHSGVNLGLKSDEVPAILQKGEMVIPKGGFGSSSQQPIYIRNILVDDQRGLEEFARGSTNESINIEHIRRNAMTVRSILGV